MICQSVNTADALDMLINILNNLQVKKKIRPYQFPLVALQQSENGLERKTRFSVCKSDIKVLPTKFFFRMNGRHLSKVKPR